MGFFSRLFGSNRDKREASRQMMMPVSMDDPRITFCSVHQQGETSSAELHTIAAPVIPDQNQNASSGTRTTTIDRPFTIKDPVAGFLNLQGQEGELMMDADRLALAPLFASCTISRDQVPNCQVLFVYCKMIKDGRIENCDTSIRELIRRAGAYIVVVASENTFESSLGPRRDEWSANIVVTFDRKGETLARFLRDLFSAMFDGQSMLMAWVTLAPQGPVDHPNCPATVMLCEAGHLVFERTGIGVFGSTTERRA